MQKLLCFLEIIQIKQNRSSSTAPLITGPFTCNSSTTTFVSTRVRGRQVSLKIENEAVNESWRYGTLRLRYSCRR